MKSKWFLVVCIAMLFIGVADAKAPEYPKFDFYSMEGGRVTSIQLRGRAVLITFFARQCLPCRMEVPFLNELQKQYPDTLTVLGVAFMENDFQKAQALIREWGIKYSVIPDPDGGVARAFDNNVFPHLFLMDYTGRIIVDYPGMSDSFNSDIKQRLTAMQPKIKEYRANGPSFYVSMLKETSMAADSPGVYWRSKINWALSQEGVRISPKAQGADYVISGSVAQAGGAVKIEIVISNSGGIEEMRFSDTFRKGEEARFRQWLTDKLKAMPYTIRRR